MNVPVLVYHGVAREADARFSRFNVDPDQFAAQMELLGAGGYQALTVRELAERLWGQRRSLPERTVAITFDDAFADFYENAWPHLRRLGLTATMYVATGYVGATSRWLHRVGEGGRPIMTWEQLGEIAQDGIELGAHGHDHVQLDIVSAGRAAADIERSREILADAIGEVASFAYPHGYHTKSVRRAVEGAGFTSACAVADCMSSPRDDRYAISRIVVGPDIDLEAFGRIVEGGGQTYRSRPVRRMAWRALRRAQCEQLVERARGRMPAGPPR